MCVTALFSHLILVILFYVERISAILKGKLRNTNVSFIIIIIIVNGDDEVGFLKYLCLSIV